MKITDVILGDALMLFTADGKSVGGATSHSLSISPEYNEIMCKDSSYTGWKKLKKIGWEVSCEHLYLESEFEKLVDNVLSDTELTIFFGNAAQRTDGADGGLETGGTANSEEIANWTKDASKMMYSGKVKISSISLNSQSGDNATYSVTFTGTGPLVKASAA